MSDDDLILCDCGDRCAHSELGTLRAELERKTEALRRIGQVDNDTGLVIDEVCAECQGWVNRDWTAIKSGGRVSCGTDCAGRIARRALEQGAPTPKEKCRCVTKDGVTYMVHCLVHGATPGDKPVEETPK